jgi:murein DD-endopeptidase MepM/ murein hydrolase activator NlpD
VKVIGRQKTIDIHFLDSLSGLAHLQAEIIQDNKSQVLLDHKIPLKEQNRQTVSLTLNPYSLKLRDGDATLKISATDHSLFENQSILIRPVKIDTVPPQLNLLSRVNYINHGGTGYVAYQPSKPVTLTGVYVNSQFFAAYRLPDGHPLNYAVYFPVPMDAGNVLTEISLFARDEAGNETKTGLPYIIKKKTFRQDKMNLDDKFLQQKMPEFQSLLPELRQKPLIDVFIYVNSQMRNDNFATIRKICEKSSPRELWEGTFLRMTNAAPMALFGDKRSYVYDGKIIGESVHAGVDLASTAMAPIEAANKGIVVFAGPLGIYGNTVIIDHGLGVFSLYAHLSSIATSVGKTVAKGENIGRSGMSGLAGGDHLHFSMIVGGQFVNPQEWWDSHWLKDNLNK